MSKLFRTQYTLSVDFALPFPAASFEDLADDVLDYLQTNTSLLGSVIHGKPGRIGVIATVYAWNPEDAEHEVLNALIIAVFRSMQFIKDANIEFITEE